MKKKEGKKERKKERGEKCDRSEWREEEKERKIYCLERDSRLQSLNNVIKM